MILADFLIFVLCVSFGNKKPFSVPMPKTITLLSQRHARRSSASVKPDGSLDLCFNITLTRQPCMASACRSFLAHPRGSGLNHTHAV